MRPDQDSYFIQMALLISTRSTCPRASHGCVLVNKRNHVLATGYNGPPVGQPHCTDEPCPGASAPSGSSLDLCMATHAEANALLQCRDVWEIKTAYITASPCIFCLRLLMNTGCERIVFLSKYPHPEAQGLWESDPRRIWEQHFVSQFNGPDRKFDTELRILPGFRPKFV